MLGIHHFNMANLPYFCKFYNLSKLRAWLASLNAEDRRTFIPLCPDFVIELQSESDSSQVLKEKMQEYLDNGLRLGWLIDPYTSKVYVYRPGLPEEVLDKPLRLSGESVLPDFELDLDDIWMS